MREKCRSDLTRVLSEKRRWHLELAERFVARGWLDRRDDYFMLRAEEIAPVVGDPAAASHLRDIVARREKQRAEERRLRMPLLMRESELAGALRRAHVIGTADASRLSGLCVSAGYVEGEVVVIQDPRHFQQMTRGAILVAPATDPSWTPLFTLAAGVIVEVGGMLSHASTVAREYGLPALANVKDATRLLRTGDRVRLNATAGFVERSL
jgi:pyruvate,water dikinase